MANSTGNPTSGQLQTLLDGPAVKPPAGITSSLDHPPNIDTFYYLTIALCVSFASLAVMLRVYTKLVLIRSIAYEDCEC